MIANDDRHKLVNLSIPIRQVHLVRVGDGEDCAVCDTPTPFWYDRRDIPLCLSCADNTPHAELPSKREWLVRLGFDLPPDWKPGPYDSFV